MAIGSKLSSLVQKPRAVTGGASAPATKRVQKELLKLAPTEGIEVSVPDDANVLVWDAKMRFRDDTPLGKSLRATEHETGQDYLQLRCDFPPSYPISAPNVRVVSPRILSTHPQKGAVIGGAICADVLTNGGGGWSPVYQMQQVLLMLQAILGDHDGTPQKGTYSEQEAKRGFAEFTAEHSWKK